MKTVFIIFLLIALSFFQSYSEVLNGKYCFNQSTIEFKPGGLFEFHIRPIGYGSFLYQGFGNVKVNKGLLKVNLIEVLGIHQGFEKVEHVCCFDSVTIYVYDVDQNAPLKNMANVYILTDGKIKYRKILSNGVVQFPFDKVKNGDELRIVYLGYPVFSQVFMNKFRSDFRVLYSVNPGFDSVNKFINDGGNGLGFRMQKDTIFLRLRSDLNIVLEPRSEKHYEWIPFVKEK